MNCMRRLPGVTVQITFGWDVKVNGLFWVSSEIFLNVFG